MDRVLRQLRQVPEHAAAAGVGATLGVEVYDEEEAGVAVTFQRQSTFGIVFILNFLIQSDRF